MVGVYFLKQNEKIVYVGQSVNIERRIKDHKNSDKVFDDYTYVECDKELLNSTEESFILQHNPVYNIRKATIKVYPESLIKNNVSKDYSGTVIIKLNPELGNEFDSLAEELNMKRTELINYLIKFYKDKKGV